MIPDVVWSYWAQGKNEMPEVVRLCISSWSSRGGMEDVRVLEDQSVFDYLTPEDLPISFFELPVQMKSDALRFALLARYGGIWMDASTLASRPIVPWLREDLGVEDFFVFRNGELGTGGRLFEIGFIASSPDQLFMQSWSNEFNRFFSRRRIHLAHSPAGPAPWWAKKIFAAINVWSRKTSRRSAFWAHIPLRWLPFYPYFISYYLANGLLLSPTSENLLGQIPMVSAADYLWFRSETNRGRMLDALDNLDDGYPPVHDLEFRHELDSEEIEGLRNFVDTAVDLVAE